MAANSSIGRGAELWKKNSWQQILEIWSRSKRVYTNLYFIYDTLCDSAYIGDYPKVLLPVQQKNNTHIQEYVKKIYWGIYWGRGWGWRGEKRRILPLQSNHQNCILSSGTAWKDSSLNLVSGRSQPKTLQSIFCSERKKLKGTAHYLWSDC